MKFWHLLCDLFSSRTLFMAHDSLVNRVPPLLLNGV